MHIHSHLTTALALLTIPRTLALGINCRGSFWCMGTGAVAAEVALNLNSISPTDSNGNDIWASDHELIACSGYICAFYQNTNGRGGTIADAQRLAQEIVEHECQFCGSCPVDYPDANDVKEGELTVNFVVDTCGTGVCKSFA